MPTGHASRRGYKDFKVNMTREQIGCSLVVCNSCAEALTQASADGMGQMGFHKGTCQAMQVCGQGPGECSDAAGCTLIRQAMHTMHGLAWPASSGVWPAASPNQRGRQTAAQQPLGQN